MATQEKHVEQADGLLQKAARAANKLFTSGWLNVDVTDEVKISLVIDKARSGCISFRAVCSAFYRRVLCYTWFIYQWLALGGTT